jgi:hypothetical protein
MRQVDVAPDRGVLLAEDQALKAKLSNLYVRGPNNTPLRVQVWFGMPSAERDAIYPFITIDLVDIVFANDRAHCANVLKVSDWPSEFSNMEDYVTANGIDADPSSAEAMIFHPYDIYYYVSVHTRSTLHDRHLTSMLLSTNYMPLSNFGYLDVPADNTVRWLDNLGFASQDYKSADDKWVRRKVHTIKVSAHMAPENPRFYHKVLKLSGMLYGDITGNELLASWENDAETVDSQG